MLKVVLLFRYLNQGRRNQIDIGGGGGGGDGGRCGNSMHPKTISKSRTPEIQFPAFWEVIFNLQKSVLQIKSLGTSRSGLN